MNGRRRQKINRIRELLRRLLGILLNTTKKREKKYQRLTGKKCFQSSKMLLGNKEEELKSQNLLVLRLQLTHSMPLNKSFMKLKSTVMLQR